MAELRETNLNDPGNTHDGLRIVLCKAEKEGETRHTCVRAYNTLPIGAVYCSKWSALLNIDILNGHDAWVYRSAPSFGEITATERLQILLGQTVVVNGWT